MQTAVVGGKNSEHPVILPMDARELDRWRRKHPNYSYWCGLQLGGCGGELSDRRYTDKVCHFAHHPSAPVCHRTANGETSADHLFVKRGVQRLLQQQKIRGKAHVRSFDASRPGGAVDVHLPDGNRRIRFQMAHIDLDGWQRSDAELRATAGEVDWVMPGVRPVTRELVERHGTALCLRLHTEGGERRVEIGSLGRGRDVRWDALEACSFTSAGLIMPSSQSVRSEENLAESVAFPVSGGLVFKLVARAKGQSSTPFTWSGRRLFTAHVKPANSRPIRALVSLPVHMDGLLVRDRVYRSGGGARLVVTHDSDYPWAVFVERCDVLDSEAARKTGLLAEPAVERDTPASASVPGPRKVRAVNVTAAASKEHVAAPQAKVKAGEPAAPRRASAPNPLVRKVSGLVDELQALHGLSGEDRVEVRRRVRSAESWIRQYTSLKSSDFWSGKATKVAEEGKRLVTRLEKLLNTLR
ncbi:hypothetical protein ACF08N_01495 [Streptomyces sp. NPDC015127]|uniref:hypothetical protein n=1 Tax=Streptomyces sp. NPDC015127 TaxID=3364939 RepID=UPI003701F78B